jgi:hypothetical protein
MGNGKREMVELQTNYVYRAITAVLAKPGLIDSAFSRGESD